MIMDAVVERCVEQSPVTFMARLALQRALEPAWIDELFERAGGTRYTRELLFSITVELMPVVAVGLRPSVHAAAKACKELPVSVQALYDKIQHTAPSLIRALVQESAACLHEELMPMMSDKRSTVPGYRLRIVDGKHLPASETCLKPLRGYHSAALPGQSLVYDPDLDMVVDLVPCEDDHAQERSLMELAQRQAQPGELCLVDRNFSTRCIFCCLHGQGSCFIVREHGRTPNPQPLGPVQYRGRSEAGAVYEDALEVKDDAGQRLWLRRVKLHLERATEDGDTAIRLLSNLPASQFTPRRVTRLYRQRWQTESLFQCLESVLHSEVVSLGHLRSPLLALGIAVLAYNTLAVLQSAVWSAHKLHTNELELSSFYFADAIRPHYAGMMMAVVPAAGEGYDKLTAAQLARVLLHMARYANPKSLCKDPRNTRNETKKDYVPEPLVRRHVATAQMRKDARTDKLSNAFKAVTLKFYFN